MNREDSDLKSIATRAAQTTTEYEFRVREWGEEVALAGLVEIAQALNDDHFERFVRGLMARWIAENPGPDAREHLAPGRVLTTLATRADPDGSLFERAYRLAEFFRELPRDSLGVRLHCPAGSRYAQCALVDCMYVDGPFLALLGAVTGDDSLQETASECLLSHARVLQDKKSGLFAHMYDSRSQQTNGVAWGRGNGWALLGLSETSLAMPTTHASYGEIHERLLRLLHALIHHQEDDGHWHTVLDDRNTYTETSVAAMVAATPLSSLAAEEFHVYSEMQRRAREATLRSTSAETGILWGVSTATPPGYSHDHYNRIAQGREAFPWGQGPLLLTLARWALHEQTDPLR